MLFSVIIPCFNAAGTIERSLDSLRLQSFKDWEVICVDDCSQDNTREIIKTYSKNHGDMKLILLSNEENNGPGVSRNNGITIARGEYLCFLDADDNFDVSALSVLEETIQKTNADVVLFGQNQVIGDSIRRHFTKTRNSIAEYLAFAGESLCGGCWHRSLWKDLEIPAISNAEDIAVIPILISRSRKVVTVDEILYNYVYSNSSTSNRHHPQVSYCFVASFQYTLKHIDSGCFQNELEFHGIKTIIYGATLNALKARMSNNEVLAIWSKYEQLFPNWKKNCYLKEYECSKRLFVRAAANHCFFVLRCYAFLHSTVLRILGKQ